MKLKGTFKIRLFQGSDWNRKDNNEQREQDQPESSREGAATTSGLKLSDQSASGATKDVNGKSVRFRKDDLLQELTAPATSTTRHSTAGGKDGKYLISGKSKSGTSKPPRASRPLFEVEIIMLISACCFDYSFSVGINCGWWSGIKY